MLKMDNLCVYITNKFYGSTLEAEYGEAHTLVEEMAELTKELMHYYHRPDRVNKSMDKIIEELSHVLMSCRTFQISTHISDAALQSEINKKYLKHGLAPEA